jgi:hypothetical protein
MSDETYERITYGCLWCGVVSAFMYDYGWHVVGLSLAVLAGAVSITVYFKEGHRP